MSGLTFEATTYHINNWLIVHLPSQVSKQLPSRGMVMGTGTINGKPFTAPLEPDGQAGHWFKIDQVLQASLSMSAPSHVSVSLAPAINWPRPLLPKDLKLALANAPRAQAVWNTITPKAQWEWLRWIRSTKQAATRTRRITVAISKMNAGMRRPCCFNSAMCTEPQVSKNGVLLAPTQR